MRQSYRMATYTSIADLVVVISGYNRAMHQMFCGGFRPIATSTNGRSLRSGMTEIANNDLGC